MNPQTLDFGELNSAVDDLVETLESAQHEIEERDFEISEQREQLAAQRRTIATLRARLTRGSRGRQNFRGKRHKRGKRFCICGQCATMGFNVLNVSHLNGWQLHQNRILHAQRIAAIRNFGALP